VAPTTEKSIPDHVPTMLKRIVCLRARPVALLICAFDYTPKKGMLPRFTQPTALRRFHHF